ncbi:MAG: hypothetical protein EG825_05520 [Rhodocyclaceae bacterium]|nr:hypothetical protein [Rhodocyclaceae bacterium]
MATGFELRHQNDVKGLLWIHRFGWLRSAELGRLIWPLDRFSRTRADRIIRGWLDRSLVIARQLPNGARRAVVLSDSGARLLQEAAHVSARTGKDWGETDGNRWSPNLTWQHDLIAAGVLVRLFERGWTILPEKMLRRDNPGLVKIPDGIALNGTDVIWLEVESARKSGRAMLDLARTVSDVASGECPLVSGHRPTVALVAYVKDAKDERGHGLNHRQRVTSAIQKTSKRDVTLQWGPCQLAGCGVSTLDIQPEHIIADRSSQILRVLNAGGWHEDDTGCLVANYGPVKAIIWDDDIMGWAYQIEGTGVPAAYACQADNKSAAMRGCASLLAAL